MPYTSKEPVEPSKYAFLNTRTGEWLKSFTLEFDGHRNRCGITPADDISQRLVLTAKPYEPNQVRVEELLSSLSDDIWESVLICSTTTQSKP